MRDEKYFKFAYHASRFSDSKKQKIGCVAIYRGKVLAVGWNQNKTFPLQARYNRFRGFNGYDYPSFIHAEMMVVGRIRKLDIDFSQVDIYVLRTNSFGSYALSKPCKACEEAMRDLKIKRIHFINQSGEFDMEVF